MNGTISQESQLFFGTSNKIVYKRQIPLTNDYKPKEDNIIKQTFGKSFIFFLLLAKINIKLFLIDWIDLARKKFNVIRPKKTSAFSSSATRSGWKKNSSVLKTPIFFVAFIFLLIARQSPRVSFYTRKNRCLFSLLISDNFHFQLKRPRQEKHVEIRKYRCRLKKTTSNKKNSAIANFEQLFFRI